MMAFIDSVFHVIGSFISMVFEAIVAAVQLGFSVLGGLLGLVVNLGMLLLVVGLVALVIDNAISVSSECKRRFTLLRCWRLAVRCIFRCRIPGA